jgi:hypothetical protein
LPDQVTYSHGDGKVKLFLHQLGSFGLRAEAINYIQKNWAGFAIRKQRDFLHDAMQKGCGLAADLLWFFPCQAPDVPVYGSVTQQVSSSAPGVIRFIRKQPTGSGDAALHAPKPRKVLPPAGVQPQPPSGPSHPSLVFENNPQIDVRLSAFDHDPVNRAMSIGRFVHPDPSQAASMSPEDLLRWKAAASSCTSSILKMAALSIPRVGIETPSRLLHCLELFGQLQISLLTTDLPSKWDSYDSIVASFDKLVAGGYTVKDNLEYVVACDRTFQGTKQMFQILAKK